VWLFFAFRADNLPGVLQSGSFWHTVLDATNQNVMKENQDLSEGFNAMTQTGAAHQETISRQKEKMLQQQVIISDLQSTKRDAFRAGVLDGIEQGATNTNKKSVMLDVPDKVDSSTLSMVIHNTFTIIHPRKEMQSKADIAAAAVWSLYDGKCCQQLKQWSMDLIRNENPYRKGQEIAKVMDLSAGQLNLSGYNTLRQGLETKTRKGKSRMERDGFVANTTSRRHSI
jgi:hypothetical protein